MPKKREDEIKRLISREYRIYSAEEREKSVLHTTYEKLCNSCGKALNIDPGKKDKKAMQDAIDFCHMNVTPTGVMSLTTLFFLVAALPFRLVAIHLPVYG